MSRLTPVDEVPRVEELDCGSRLSFGMCKDRSGWGVDANAVVSWRSLRGVRALAKVHAAQKLALPAELHISSSIITHFSPKVLLHISLYHHLGSYSGALRQTVASSAQETRAFIGSSSVEFAAFGTEILRSGTEAGCRDWRLAESLCTAVSSSPHNSPTLQPALASTMMSARMVLVAVAAAALLALVGVPTVRAAADDGQRYGIVLDAGSSGTRVYLFTWVAGDETATLSEVMHKKVSPGVSYYSEEPSKAADSVRELLKHACAWLPGVRSVSRRN